MKASTSGEASIGELETFLPQRLKTARAALGLTQAAMAAKSGVSVRAYQGYEDGRSIPGGHAISFMVKSGINANWLLTGEGLMLLAELLSQKHTSMPLPPAAPRINVGALEAIIEGALKVAKNAPASAIAAHAASVYAKCIEDGLITPEGIGDGNMNDAV